MRVSRLISKKHKEKPAEAQINSHIFMLRGGYVRPVANGIFSLLTPALRVREKVIRIIREEMEKLGGQEIKMPVVLPRELWDESGRWQKLDQSLLRFSDRSNHDMLLAMTHEEAVVALARTEVSSYKEYPFMLYQFQTKFRDEARSRGGLIRVREFTMKDAYSFHTSVADMDRYYDACAKAYDAIFRRCGIPQVKAIQSDSGMMGGKVAHEYQLLTPIGEDKVVVCEACQSYRNAEVATTVFPKQEGALLPLEKIATPAAKTIDELVAFTSLAPSQMAKTVFYTTEKGETLAVVVRGDVEVNECKLQKLTQCLFDFASDDDILKAGGVPGFASGIGLKCRVIVDPSAANAINLLTGANEEGFHVKNMTVSRDMPQAEVADVALVKDGDICPTCGQKLSIERGIEVGNIFKLGDFYTRQMNMTFTDENGQDKHPVMACYGIGVGRLFASVAEVCSDNFGPVWPLSIAPWQVQINALGLDKPGILETAEKIYADLTQAGIEVLYDDRGLSAGVQFSEADLTGIPLRLIVAPKKLADGVIEFKVRGREESGVIKPEEVVSFCQNWIAEEMKKYR